MRLALGMLLLGGCAAAAPEAGMRALRVEPTEDDAATIASNGAALGVDALFVPASRVADVLPEARKRNLRVFARVRVRGLPIPEEQDRHAAEVKAAVAGADGVHLEGLEFDPAFEDDERTRILFALLAGGDPEDRPAAWAAFRENAVRQTVEKIVRAVRPATVTASRDAPVDLVFGVSTARVVSRSGDPLSSRRRAAPVRPVVPADPEAVRRAGRTFLLDGYAEATKDEARLRALRQAMP